MGLKTLTLQILPWHSSCFHLPALTPIPSSSSSSTATTQTVRVIASDGRVKLFDRPIPAAELMKQHPLHLICRSDTFFIGQKVPPLSASDKLQPGHSYFLLPSHFFHSVLSFVTLSSSLVNIKNSNALLLRSFDIRKTEKGMLQVRVKDEMILESSSKRSTSRICNSEELEKEYTQLVGCKSRKWKPRLETITEIGGGGANSSKSRRRTSALFLIKKR